MVRRTSLSSRQVGWAVLGLVTMTLLMRIDYRKFNRPIVVFPAVAVTTLLLLGVFLLRDSHNTHRWIRFGGSSFQPSEIAKPVLVLFLAWFLQDKLHSIRDWRNTLIAGGSAPPGVYPAHRQGA